MNDERINLNKANENGYTIFANICRKKYIDVIKYMLNDDMWILLKLIMNVIWFCYCVLML